MFHSARAPRHSRFWAFELIFGSSRVVFTKQLLKGWKIPELTCGLTFLKFWPEFNQSADKAEARIVRKPSKSTDSKGASEISRKVRLFSCYLHIQTCVCHQTSFTRGNPSTCRLITVQVRLKHSPWLFCKHFTSFLFLHFNSSTI